MINLAQIQAKLQATFSPLHLEIRDDSEGHRGHSGYTEGEISHLHITIVAEQFEGLMMIKQHKLVNQCLKEEFDAGLHALALKTIKPSKWNK